MSVLQVAMMGGLPYTTIRDGLFAHPVGVPQQPVLGEILQRWSCSQVRTFRLARLVYGGPWIIRGHLPFLRSPCTVAALRPVQDQGLAFCSHFQEG
jgi:hypothetical protein